MTSTPGWERWEERWRASKVSPAELDAMIEGTRHTRRGIVLVRVLSTALAVVALAVVGAALRHAGNAVEAALGLAVGVGIAVVWLMDVVNQERAAQRVEVPADEYRAARRALCARHDRFARLGWIVVALDLAFLLPWWIGGFAVHGAGFHAGQLLTIWGPLVLMAGFVAWTISLRKRARAELQRLARDEDSALE